MRTLAIFLIGISFIGCGKGFESSTPSLQLTSAAAGPTPLEVETKAMGIFQAKCSSCHNATSGNIGPGEITRSSLMAQGWVVPGGAANSILFDSISKDRMPQGAPLSDEEKEAIRAWILLSLPSLPMEPISFANTRAVLQTYCLTCHSVTGASGSNLGGVNLETFANVRARVVPGKPFESRIFDAVINKRMPLGPIKLPVQELAIIYSWIYAGASEN